jgi:histidinol-phosphate aminotransferase
VVDVPVRLRDDLAALPSYVAGRTVPGAVKLASNEMPQPPLPAVLDAIARAASAGNRYPDIAVTSLTARLAEHHGVDPARIAVGCGSVALCGQLVQAVCAPGDEVVFAWRSFEAYPIVALTGHAQAVRVPLTTDHVHDLDAMADAITPRTRMVVVCNPNNPTGTAVDEDALRAFLARVPSDVLVVLDEAYREFVTDAGVPDGLGLAAEHDNICVLRTFSKAHRLAGLRVGYAVAPPELAAALRGVSVPFAVSAPAQAAALAALENLDELLADCAGAVAEVERMTSELRTLGYEVPPSQANFVWLPLGERAAEFAAHALENKVVVRAFAGDGVRVSAGTAEEVDLFLAAAGSFPR